MPHLHNGVSSARYQINHEACARLAINAVILRSQLNQMHSQKNKKKEGEEKYVPSNIAKLCSKWENKAVGVQDEHSTHNL